MNFLITNDENYKNDFNLNQIHYNNFKIFFDNNWKTNNNNISKGTSNNFCKINIIYIILCYLKKLLKKSLNLGKL